MKPIFILLTFSMFSSSLLAQTNIELQCLKSIIENSKDIQFPKSKGPISIRNDSIQFGKSKILLRNSSEEAFLIFKNGLLFPELILVASTTGDGKLRMNSLAFNGTVSISSFTVLPKSQSLQTVKTFSFLVWQEGFANPKLYMLQLANDKADSTTINTEFIEQSRLSAFGFCSILM